MGIGIRCIFSLVALLLGSVELGWAQDVGSVACREVQMEAHEAIPEEPRNHGQAVSAAAQVVSDAEDAGEITPDCASCIIEQIAQRHYDIDDVEACGPQEICPADCFTTAEVDTYVDANPGAVCETAISELGGLNVFIWHPEEDFRIAFSVEDFRHFAGSWACFTGGSGSGISPGEADACRDVLLRTQVCQDVPVLE